MSYVQDTKKFERLSSRIQPALNWNLKIGRANTYYFEWDEFMDVSFVSFITALTKLSGDKEFYFYDLDIQQEQDLMKEYFQHFNQYPLIELPIDIDEREYFSELNKKYHIKDYFVGKKERADKYRDRLFMVSITCAYAIFPPSMNWHIYGEYDIELARLVTKVGLPDVPFPHDFIPEEEAKRLIALKRINHH